ncbi:MAG: hypothetical protein JKX90_05210 [Colwellia sp.]|nr:hypothetical protein [Colwellia sp.]
MKQNNDKSESVKSESISFNFENKSFLPQKAIFHWLSGNVVTVLLLIALCATLYFVIFSLPQSVDKAHVANEASVILAKEPLKVIDESPWHEVQLTKYRRAAQEVLSTLLQQQQVLEDQHVELWNADKFSQAIKTAESGDFLYRSQKFDQAITTYNRALQQLNDISAQADSIFSDYLEQGLQALAANNAQKAKEKLQVALYISENNKMARSAFDRAIVLDQVLLLVKAGEVLIDELLLIKAKEKFTQAYALDHHSPRVNQQLLIVNQAIMTRAYSTAMSAGYRHLQIQQFKLAIKNFTLADKINPNKADAKGAIEQTQNKRTQFYIADHIKKAQNFEHSEDWLLAKDSYQAALTLDGSLMHARLGVIRTLARGNLEKKILYIINKPQRLANRNVYQQAMLTQQQAQQIKQPGVKLAQQIHSVEQVLLQMTTPVSLRIESDNQTRITLHRVGELGSFLSKNISLRPGDYTLVGSRNGFRDVRQDFTLMPASQLKKIIILCNEKVTNG